MPTLFDFAMGQAAKAEGMGIAALSKSQLLTRARDMARALALKNDGRCNSDMVGREMKAHGLPPLGPAAGSLFVGPEWRFTGERVKSSLVSNHARELKVWEYVVSR